MATFDYPIFDQGIFDVDVPEVGVAASSFGWLTNADGVVPSIGISASSFGWSTEAAGETLYPAVGDAASSFGWSTDAVGVFEVIPNRSHITFGWSTHAVGVVPLITVTRAKNRRLRPLLLPKGVWYQPHSNPEARLNE